MTEKITLYQLRCLERLYSFVCYLGLSLQSQAVDPEQFSSQESNIMLEQKTPVFPQQYASQAQMAQGSYNPMQDPNFHTMGQRPSYATLRMQPRPGLRPTGLVQNQPNQLRLQLQHRLQAQQVCSSRASGEAARARGSGQLEARGRRNSRVLGEGGKLIPSLPR